MSIHELAISDTQLVAGGDDLGVHIGQCALGILAIFFANGGTTALRACKPLAQDLISAGQAALVNQQLNSDGTTYEFYSVSADQWSDMYNSGMYETGFNMNDSFGGEPSI